MTISVVDIFSVGVGPSSSHTVGPMRAAKSFVESLPALPAKVHTELRGSLSATGKGHATDRAVILGSDPLLTSTEYVLSPPISPSLVSITPGPQPAVSA